MAFAASLTSLAVAGWTTGLPHNGHLGCCCQPPWCPPWSWFAFEAPPTELKGTRPTDWPRSFLALMGLSTVRPSFDISCTRPLPAAADAAAIGRRLPQRRSCSTLVVSHHFDGLLQAQAPGVLQPEPNRVRRVLQYPRRQTTRLAWEADGDGTTPRNAFRTLQRFSLVDSRRHVTARLCLLTVYSTCLPVRYLRPLVNPPRWDRRHRSNESRTTGRTKQHLPQAHPKSRRSLCRSTGRIEETARESVGSRGFPHRRRNSVHVGSWRRRSAFSSLCQGKAAAAEAAIPARSGEAACSPPQDPTHRSALAFTEARPASRRMTGIRDRPEGQCITLQPQLASAAAPRSEPGRGLTRFEMPPSRLCE